MSDVIFKVKLKKATFKEWNGKEGFNWEADGVSFVCGEALSDSFKIGEKAEWLMITLHSEPGDGRIDVKPIPVKERSGGARFIKCKGRIRCVHATLYDAAVAGVDMIDGDTVYAHIADSTKDEQ